MVRARVGYHRIYNALNCSLEGQNELLVQFSLGQHEIEVYFGHKPRYGLDLYEPVPTGSTDRRPKGYKWQRHADATQSPLKGTLFTEITAYRDIDVPEHVLISFSQQEGNAHNELLNIAHTHREDFEASADCVAGIIGLLESPQPISDFVCENYVALRPDGSTAISSYTPPIDLFWRTPRVLRNIGQLADVMARINASDARLRSTVTPALQWLLRAWSEGNHVYRFLNLFIPLEVLLNEYGVPKQSKIKADARVIRKLISAHAVERKAESIQLLDAMLDNYLRPSLVSRFEVMAQRARMPGWETDVEAFKRFYDLRNGLVHRGLDAVEHQVRVSDNPLEEEARDLDELVERYVGFALFN